MHYLHFTSSGAVTGLYPPSVKVVAELVQTETAMGQAMAAIALIGNSTAMHPMGQSGHIGPRGQVTWLTLILCLCMWLSVEQVQ